MEHPARGGLVGLVGWVGVSKPPAPLGCDPTSLGLGREVGVWLGEGVLWVGVFFWDDEGVNKGVSPTKKNRKKLVHRCS